MKSRFSLLSPIALGACALVACDNPSSPPLGSIEITASSPTVQRELTTADGWSIKFERFLVHVSEVTVAGDDEVVAAYADPQIIDLVAPAPKSLLASDNRMARPWERVSLEIGPASPDTEVVLVEPVSEADGAAMQKEGYAIHVVAKATKGEITKTLDWGFQTDTIYDACADGPQRGLVVPPDGGDTADVVLSGEVLFSDDLSAPGSSLRADAIAAADADSDGIVTLDELREVPLLTAQADGAPYSVPDDSAVVDLGAFVEALTGSMITRFRANGRCTAKPVTEEP